MNPSIRVGIGGWTFEPWRNNFYPAGWPHARELEYASQRLTAIEVNGTYYSSQKPATFAKWRDETPADFVFSLKASRFATNRRVLAEAGESVQRFVHSGIAELAHKLGPIVWQFAPTKVFDPADFEAFLKLLPAQADGVALRHVLDVRHASFKCPEYLALAQTLPGSHGIHRFRRLPQLRRHHRRLRLLPRDAHRRVTARRLHTAGVGADRGLRDAVA